MQKAPVREPFVFKQPENLLKNFSHLIYAEAKLTPVS